MDKIILLYAFLNCSAEQSSDYFSKNELLEQWLTVKADVEMKVGGKYELFWTPEDSDLTNNSTYGCRVLAVDKPYLINIEWKGNAEQKVFMNEVKPLTNVTILFSESGGKTKVTLIHSGWREGEDWEKAYNYFKNAWTMAFSALEEKVNGSVGTVNQKSDSLFCYYLKLSNKYNDPSAWNDETRAIIASHSKWMEDLGTEGILIFAGRTLLQPGDKNLFGIAVIKANSLDHAKTIMSPDPAVKAGIQEPQIFPYSIALQYFNNLN